MFPVSAAHFIVVSMYWEILPGVHFYLNTIWTLTIDFAADFWYYLQTVVKSKEIYSVNINIYGNCCPLQNYYI